MSGDKDPKTGHFLPGNKYKNTFKKGQSGNPKGRTSENLMSIVKRVALQTEENGKSSFENIIASLTINLAKLRKQLDKMEETDKNYKKTVSDYIDMSTKLSDFLLRGSGDFSTKQQTEVENKNIAVEVDKEDLREALDDIRKELAD